ncbi:MAG TPA: hypothetical protein VK791_02210 [bacterium]|jgi:hypothetical protein|nr:hypothetical protein [bacterium]
MVKGLDLFKEHFKNHTDSFVIIGGTACSILFEEVSLEFRATKDIDIVLYAEVLNPEFGKSFWDFVHQGDYQVGQKSTGEKTFYRFKKPSRPDYPEMLELFSAKPEGFDLFEGSHLTPIPFDDETASLSAILLNDDYYAFVQAGRKMVKGLPVLDAEHLIPLKAKAFSELSARRDKGDSVDSKDIRKHQSDIFRLFPLLTEQTRVTLTGSPAEDMRAFLQSVQEPIDLRNFGINNMGLAEVLENLRTIYGL